MKLQCQSCGSPHIDQGSINEEQLSEEHIANLAIWTKKDFIIEETLGLTVSFGNCKRGAEILKHGELYYSREGGQGTRDFLNRNKMLGRSF